MSSSLSFAFMPAKTPYTANSRFAMSRMVASRAYTQSPVPYKPHKTQNGGGVTGRLQRLKAQAAMGDATRVGPTPGDISIPNFGGADPNIVNANLAKARNIGAAVPRNAIPR